MTTPAPVLTEPASDRFVAPTASERFAELMAELIDAIVVQATASLLPRPILFMIWSFTTKIAERFAKVVARAPARPRTTPTQPAKPRTTKPRPEKPRLPYAIGRGFFWLRHALPIRYTPILSPKLELAALLTTSGMIALIAEKPSLARILRPLCHMLGIERPPCLQIPKPAPTENPEPTPRAPKPMRTPKPKIDLTLPIPMGPGNRFWPPWLKSEKTPT